MKRLLFFGDSITDARRSRDEDDWLGSGYVALIAGLLGSEHPGEYEILNRGISGDRSVDLYARIKKDCLNLKPDVITIYIGVNDVLHEAAHQNGVSNQKFYQVINLILDEIRNDLPESQVILISPFVFPGAITDYAWTYIHAEVPLRAQMLEQIAQEKKLPLIRLQSVFEEAILHTQQLYFIRDGVHPTIGGHGVIAREWIRTYKGLIES